MRGEEESEQRMDLKYSVAENFEENKNKFWKGVNEVIKGETVSLSSMETRWERRWLWRMTLRVDGRLFCLAAR